MGNKTSAPAAPAAPAVAAPAVAAPAVAAPAAPAVAAAPISNLNRLRARMPVPSAALPTAANFAVSRMPAVPTRPITVGLSTELAGLAGRMESKSLYTLMNDYAAQLASIEFSKGKSGLGSLIRKYFDTRGPISTDDAVFDFAKWLLQPTVQRVIGIREDELVTELQDLVSGKTAARGLSGRAANIAIRTARLKYGQAGGKSRRSKGRKNRRRTAKQKHRA
jgi:hypothetical protein